MKKRIAFRKLGRKTSHRTSMLYNMVTSLVMNERIVTTEAKAKELRSLADKVITMAKQQDLSARRRARKIVRGPDTLSKLFDILGPRYEHREGRYTRVLKLARKRDGDNAPMAVIEYVDRPGEIRAARPPTKIQKQLQDGIGIEQILRNMGIPPPEELLSENEMDEISEQLSATSISK